MTYNSFKEYLMEVKFTDPDDGKIKYSIPTQIKPIKNAKEIVQDLRDCLEYLRDSKLSSFVISDRNINIMTIEHMLKTENSDLYKKDVNVDSSSIKTWFINKVLSIRSLEYYLTLSEESDNKHVGWVYEFIIPSYFKTVFRAEDKVGNKLYFKFNFLKCFDKDGRILVDQSKLKLDTISIHPTNRGR